MHGTQLGTLLLFIILLIVIVAGVGGGYGWGRVRRDVQLLQCRQDYKAQTVPLSTWDTTPTSYSKGVGSYRLSNTCPAPPATTGKRVVVYMIGLVYRPSLSYRRST